MGERKLSRREVAIASLLVFWLAVTVVTVILFLNESIFFGSIGLVLLGIGGMSAGGDSATMARALRQLGAGR